jgi:putative membrane protein insertion efficiency factor
MAHVVTCRFQPSCSLYGLQSIRRYGALRGGLRTIGRIARCNPMTPAGTRDEVQ